MHQERLSTVAQLHQNTKHQTAPPVPVRGNSDCNRSPSDTLPKARRRVVQEPLWVAVSFPFLPLEALGKTTQQQPMAVYAQQGQTHTVITPNQPAQKSGVRSGMTLTAAQVLSPALQAVPQDVSAESEWLARLALLASRWTPAVSIAGDDLLLEISGSTRLFGGANQLLGKIRSRLTFETQSPCISAMPTAASALLCVRNGKSLCITAKEGIHAVIRKLPAKAVVAGAKQQRALKQYGISTVGDLLRLPRDGLARRLGPDLVHQLDRLLGKQADPQAAIAPPPVFQQDSAFDPGIANTGQLMPFMEILLGKLKAHLIQHHVLAEQLEWHLLNDSNLSVCIPVYLTHPRGNTLDLMKLCRLAFEGFQTPDLITHLSLRVRRFAPLPSSSADLFSILPRTTDREISLIERLQNRLGRQAVQGIGMQPDHRPEKAWSRCAVGKAVALSHGAQRPLWLFDTPRSIQMSNRQLLLGSQSFLLQRQRERICSGWWDSQSVRRDYYHAKSGALRAWVFRDLDSGIWQLHGIF
ncbi:MAG: DNA polymerase Y family protein [Proteobacteria bacterium TMED51]|jgi:protein ImuB|nr:MAG: DNA polymerase Y family protein [Proteobacteria bacterium TMED51]RPG02104.1 MAG: DNA polymerase Y family protein [Proteobacteria bacterium TMED51]